MVCACPCGARCASPPSSIKMLGSSSLHIAYIVLHVPPFPRLATASHVRRPTDVFVAQYPIEDTGGSAIQVMGPSGFGNPGFSGFRTAGLPGNGFPEGGAACPCGARRGKVPGLKWVGSVVLFPLRAILSQGKESGGSLRRCLALPGKGRCECAYSALFALRAKALQRGAPDHGVSREETGFQSFSPSGDFPGAPGNGLRPTRDKDTRHLTDGTRPLPPAKPSTLSVHGKRGPLQVAPHRPRISRRTSSVRPRAALRARKSQRPFPSTSHSPDYPAGGTAGSARTGC